MAKRKDKGPQSEGGESQERALIFKIDARPVLVAVLVTMVTLQVLLLALDLTMNVMGWLESGALRRLFNMTREDGLGSWVAVTQVVLVALTAWVVYAVGKEAGMTRRTRIGWLLVAVFLTWLAVDDGASIHERMGTVFDVVREEAEGAGKGGFAVWSLGFPSYAWQIVFAPFYALAVVGMVGFLWTQVEGTGRRLLILTPICFAMAVFMDFIEGLEPDHRWNLYTLIADRTDIDVYTFNHFRQIYSEPYDALRHFSKTLEEVIEMFGFTVLWLVTLDHLSRIASVVRLRIVRGLR